MWAVGYANSQSFTIRFPALLGLLDTQGTILSLRSGYHIACSIGVVHAADAYYLVRAILGGQGKGRNLTVWLNYSTPNNHRVNCPVSTSASYTHCPQVWSASELCPLSAAVRSCPHFGQLEF